MADNRWKIHKFGGSSLADADCFRRVAGLVMAYDDRRLGVVVSAMGGMTDALIHLAVLAERADAAAAAAESISISVLSVNSESLDRAGSRPGQQPG